MASLEQTLGGGLESFKAEINDALRRVKQGSTQEEAAASRASLKNFLLDFLAPSVGLEEDPEGGLRPMNMRDALPLLGIGALVPGGRKGLRVIKGGKAGKSTFKGEAVKQAQRKKDLKEIKDAERLLERRIQRTEAIRKRRSPEATARRKILQPETIGNTFNAPVEKRTPSIVEAFQPKAKRSLRTALTEQKVQDRAKTIDRLLDEGTPISEIERILAGVPRKPKPVLRSIGKTTNAPTKKGK